MNVELSFFLLFYFPHTKIALTKPLSALVARKTRTRVQVDISLSYIIDTMTATIIER